MDTRIAIENWLSFLRSERRASALTTASYGRDLGRFAGFIGDSGLGGVTIAGFRGWIASLAREGLGPSSIARHICAVRSFYRFCEREGIAYNAAVQLLKTPRRPKRLSSAIEEEEALRLLSAFDAVFPGKPWVAARDRAIFTLIYGTGLRISEALALNEGDVSGESILVSGKGKKQRIAPILPAVRREIARYLELRPFSSAALFVGEKGARLSPRVVQRDLEAARNMLQLPASTTPHSLR
ncbi:MAG: tyrosine-type recombinase/integrase, partial [Rickettsiales bacterium]|nr:tyrosine-type recombinase/integrase [Rickettsiales bacterium]